MCVACFVIPAYLIYLRTGRHPTLFLAWRLRAALRPLGFVLFKRRQRFNKFEQGSARGA